MGTYLRQHQVDEIENERRVIERTLQEKSRIEDRGNLEATIERIDVQLAEQAAPETTGEERDRMVRECGEIEGRLIPGMPSDEEMRRNPPGVVGRHKRHEKRSKSREFFEEGDISRWKNNMLCLHRGDDDPDIANFERMRPLHNHGSMLGAQIPGTQYHGTNPSQAYLDGHDRTFGNGNGMAPAPDVDGEYVPDPPTPRKRKVATRRKSTAKRTRAPNKKPPKMDTLACGKVMGKAGRHFHVKKCVPCQEAAKE